MISDILKKTVHIPREAKEWNEIQEWALLSSICDGIFDCPHSTPKITSTGPLVVRSQDIRTGIFKKHLAAHVSDETYLLRIARATPQYGDLFYSREGTYFGIAAEVPQNIKVCLGQRMVLIRPQKNHNHIFLKYWLNSPIMVNYVASFRDGTVAERLNMPTIRALPIPIFSRHKQDNIASILGSLDDKIELNRRMNETLEAMARALFRDWFVDFGPTRAKMAGEAPYLEPELWELFPDRLDDEGKPEGWHRVLLNDLISVTKGRSYKSSELQESETALVTLKSFMRGGGYRHDGLKAFTGKYHDDQIVSPRDLIVALTDVTQAADVIGKPAIVVHDQKYKTLVASLDVGIIRKKTELTGMSFIYQVLLSEEFQNHAYSYTSGTTVLHLNKEAIPSFEVCIPSQKLGAFLENSLDTMKEKVISNFQEINSLAQLRDLLLPKLMSGEISIRDAEKMVEDAA